MIFGKDTVLNDATAQFICVGTLAELRDRGRMVASTPTGPVLVVAVGDDVVALDNRCPHMGFPLHRGNIEDGILTCHWHHARFDLRSGSTFDLWADDVPLRGVPTLDGAVWVAAAPAPRSETAHWRHRLVDQTLLEHRAAEGPADERSHHRVSQCRVPLSPKQMCEKLWTLPSRTTSIGWYAAA